MVISRHDYHPFSKEIVRTGYGSDTIRKQFTGYERDDETELDFAQARYFHTAVTVGFLPQIPCNQALKQQFLKYGIAMVML